MLMVTDVAAARENHGGIVPPRVALAARAGVPPDRLIRLDANENPYGPSPRVAEALARFDGYGFYPNYRALTAAVARYAGVAPENVVLGNGGDEIIDLTVRLFVAPDEGGIVCPPAFGMYAVSTAAHRGRVLSVPRRDDFSLDVEVIETLVSRGEAGVRPRLLFLTSPGNPEGLAIPQETIRRLLQLHLLPKRVCPKKSLMLYCRWLEKCRLHMAAAKRRLLFLLL